jgi:xanthine dehydrogenase iron-sulfur cluster and FAD-binding subunit A
VLVNSCLVAMGAVAGRQVLSIEGYRKSERFARLNEAYARHGAVQCGYCTPGMILASEALLASNPHPSAEQIRTGLAGNLCRCTGYNAIVSAVLEAAEGTELWEAAGQAAEKTGLCGAEGCPTDEGGLAAEGGLSHTPSNLADALRLRSERRLTPYAGGSDLMVAADGDRIGVAAAADDASAMPGGTSTAATSGDAAAASGDNARAAGGDTQTAATSEGYLFIGAIPELRQLREDADNFYIGAACSYSQLLDDPRTPAVLRAAISQIAAPGIRNVATIGGNIANASPKADSALILYAANASLRLQSVSGSRVVPIADFIRGRGQTTMGSDELLTEIILPKIWLDNYSYQKVGARAALAISRVSFVGLFAQRDGVIQHVAVAFGAVANMVIRRPEIDALLVGKTLEEARATRDSYLSAWSKAIVPVAGRVSAEYRKTVCLNLLEDFLSQHGC